MKCWDYTTRSGDSPDELLPVLNKLGRDRWELITMVVEMVEHITSIAHTRYEVPRYVAILKRDYDPYETGGISHP